MQNFIYTWLIALLLFSPVRSQTLSKETVLLETPYGNMKIRLYEETPQHKQNFLKLVEEHFFDSLMFHRVISNFMIQGGDHLSKRAKPGDSLGHGDIGYMVPAEFRPEIFHQKGRLCAARENDDINPGRASSASQFYIVQGKVRTDEDLKKYEERINKTIYKKALGEYLNSEEGKGLMQKQHRLETEGKTDSVSVLKKQIEDKVAGDVDKVKPYQFSAKQREVYKTIGGTPHLDGSYTVFGEVVEGLEVIDKIAAVKTDKRDRPLEDVRMKMRVLR